MEREIVSESADNGKSIVQSRIESIKTLLDQSIQSVRKIASDLRPAILDTLGLVAAIDWQLGEFSRRTGISVRTNLPDSPLRLDNNKSTALYRILQEALTNVMRHSAATLVTVEIRDDGSSVVLGITDNGKGFTDSEIRKSNSFGLLGMRERVSSCGGTFEIAGSPGRGTSVTIKIPVHPLTS